MRSDVPGDDLRQAGQAQDGGAERDLRSAQQAWRNEQALMLRQFAWTISLMEQVSGVEKDLAGKLRAMAAVDGSEAAVRRLRLAEEAIKGAHEATEHGERLQRQADRWARRAEVAALLQSLDYAGRVLCDLARTEKDIADTLLSLASHDGPDRAAQLRHLAEEALAGAQRADDRAQSLYDLAASVAEGNGRSSPDT